MMFALPSATPRLVLAGDVMVWDFQMDAWKVVMLPSGIPVMDRRLKVGITAEKLFQRGMPKDEIGPHSCQHMSNCDCRYVRQHQ